MDDLETRARVHLHTALHGFGEWPDDAFQAAIDRNGGAVARHEQDHTAHPDDFTDFDDTLGLGEHAHEHKPGDPLRTWGDLPDPEVAPAPRHALDRVLDGGDVA